MSWGSFPALILILISEMALTVERASAKKSGELDPAPITMPTIEDQHG